MTPCYRPSRAIRWTWSFVVPALLLAATTANAAPPTLTSLFPAGACRGTTVEVSATGSFERWPVRAWCDTPGVRVEAAKEKGKLTVTVAPDVVPGTAWLRLYDEQGASALRPFLIGTLPEVREQEPNDDPKKPQKLPSSAVVVNGRLERAGDVDGFAVTLRKGQTLVASVEANHTLGSPMDAVLQLLSPAGFVVEQNNDDHGLDPQLAYTAPADGEYVVRLFAFPSEPDSGIRFSGGENYIYRLSVTTGGFADHAFPLALSRAASGAVELTGWNIPGAARKVSVAPGTERITFPGVANSVPLRWEPHPTTVEIEPNDPQHPQPIAPLITVSGRIGSRGDADAYEFAAKKGQKLLVSLEARAISSLLEPSLRLTDAAGKQLAQADETPTRGGGSRSAEIAFTPPQDGAYRIEVRDLFGDGGLRHVYRLRVAPPQPDYALTVAADQFVVTPEKPLDLPVTVQRLNGFNSPIELTAEGLPPGVTMALVTVPSSAATATVRLTATGGPASGAIRLVGRVAGRADLARTVTATLPGRTETTHLWLTLGKPGTAPVAPPTPRKKK